MIEGEGVPRICSDCRHSYFEEMSGGYEEPYCSKYEKTCEDSLKVCASIACPTCNKCPRHNCGWDD